MKTRAICFILAVILFCRCAAAQSASRPARQKKGISLISDLISKAFPHALTSSSTGQLVLRGLNRDILLTPRTLASAGQINVIDTAIVRAIHPNYGNYWYSDTTRHVYAFNANAMRTLDLTQKLTGDRWVDTLRETTTWSDNNVVLTRMTENSSNGQWTKIERQTNTLDSDGRPVLVLEEYWISDQWTNRFRMEFTYIANGPGVSMVLEEWQTDHWVNWDRITATYADRLFGTLTSSLHEVWRNDQWVPTTRQSYVYDANGNTIFFLTAEWSNDQWVDSLRNAYAYDPQGNILTDLFQYRRNDAWVDSTRHTYTYDIQGDMLSDVLAKSVNAQWVDTLRSTYTYDGQMHRTSELDAYYSSAWQNYGRYTDTYDSKGLLISLWHYTWLGQDMWEPSGESAYIALTDDAGNIYDYWDWYNVELSYRTVTEIPPQGKGTPMTFSLAQNYPNPFNPNTKIQFTIVNRQLTIATVFDLLGRQVATLVNEVKEPGTYTVDFDGSTLASGVYFYKLTAGQYVQTCKMMLIR